MCGQNQAKEYRVAEIPGLVNSPNTNDQFLKWITLTCLLYIDKTIIKLVF